MNILLAIVIVNGMVFLSCINKRPQQEQHEIQFPDADTLKVTPVVIQNDSVRLVDIMFTSYHDSYTNGYDKPGLIFRETDSDRTYDFGDPLENNLGHFDIVLSSKNARSGYRENPDMVGIVFEAALILKKSGQWRILSLKKAE